MSDSTDELPLLVTWCVSLVSLGPLFLYHIARMLKMGCQCSFHFNFHLLFTFAIGCAILSDVFYIACYWSGEDFCFKPGYHYTIKAIKNTTGVCLNTLFALLGYYCWKEYSVAKHGPWRWEQRSHKSTWLAGTFSLAGFLNYAEYQDINPRAELWYYVLACGVLFIRTIVVVGTLVQIIYLARTLHYSQRVLPFLNNRLLLLAAALYLLSDLDVTWLYLMYLWTTPSPTVKLVSTLIRMVTVNVAFYILAWLFRRAKRKDETLLEAL